jgi:TatD DNase family protein
MNFIDTHCHLTCADFTFDLPAVIQRARDAGVTRCIIPATDLNSIQAAMDIAQREAGIYAAVGIHPHDVAQAPSDVLDRLREAAAHPRVVAIGEIGLDYYYDFSPRHEQQRMLHRQLELAVSLGLPVILHNRDSDEDLFGIVSEHRAGLCGGQFHCFSSDAVYAGRVLDAGFHISFTGNVTYKKSKLDPVLSYVPDKYLLMETDAPYMAPHPGRGKRNEPANIPVIAEYFAGMRHQTVGHIAAVTSRNAETLFRLPKEENNS